MKPWKKPYILYYSYSFMVIFFLNLGIPLRNYQVERRVMESVGRGNYIAMFESEEI